MMGWTMLLAGFVWSQGVPTGALKVEFGKPIPAKLASEPVGFHGSKLAIVSVSQCTLNLGEIRLVPKPLPLVLEDKTRMPIVWGVRWNYIPRQPEPDPFPYSVTFEPRLKAVLKAAVVQFNRVDYRLYAAVYDAKGKLLGTASALEPVEYIRLGEMPTLFRDIELDFGVSNAFKEAAFIALAMSRPDVPKPPDAD